MELNLRADKDQMFPVLAAFLRDERDLLRGLRHLPALLEWQRLLTTRKRLQAKSRQCRVL